MGQTFIIQTQSGSNYQLKREGKKWYIYYKGEYLQIYSFGSKDPETITNPEQVAGQPIWFAKGKTHGSTKPIVRVTKEAA